MCIFAVAKNVRKLSEKMASVCPHCRFTQEESVLAKSTFCRKCQGHYTIERALAGEASIVKEPGLFSKLTKLFGGEKERVVTCFMCAHQQTLSTEAHSTNCPKCNAYIDLRDFKITGPFGRSVQTAGLVELGAKGDVTSTRLMCGTAVIEGSLRGCIICTGTAKVNLKGRMPGQLEAGHVLVEKKADVEFVRPLRTKLFEINGKARGQVVADKVAINKGGSLEGTVYARAIVVEKGGFFSGDLNIGPEYSQMPVVPLPEDRELGRFEDGG